MRRLTKVDGSRLPRPSEIGRFEDVSDTTRRVMQANKSRDTRPEMVVRRLAHAMGYRYRLHRKDLPGRPDLAFGPRRKAIFVNGCFWHQHYGCPRATKPKTRAAFWDAKFARNAERDTHAERELHALGWDVLWVWECEVIDRTALAVRLRSFLG